MSTHPVNWDLLHSLSTKPHPLLNTHDDHRHDCCPYDGEVIQEARNAHHLLDMIGIPGVDCERHYEKDLDARTYRAIRVVVDLRERMDRIATWHARETGQGGMVGDYCTECGNRFPCDTRKMVEGTYVDETL